MGPGSGHSPAQHHVEGVALAVSEQGGDHSLKLATSVPAEDPAREEVPSKTKVGPSPL